MQVEEAVTEVFFKELATACAISLIANMVSRCEFETFFKGEKVKMEEYWLWNIEPNKNQNSSDFIQQFVTNLCYDNEALIVEINGHLYVADSFTKTEYAFYEDIFSDISIKNVTLSRSYKASEVIYMQLNNIDVTRRLEGSYTSYGKVVAKSIREYIRANGQKGILNIDAVTSQAEGFRTELKELVDNRFKPYFEAENAVLPLTTGYTYTDTSKTGTTSTPADVNERINYEFELAARAFKIPKSLVLGDVTEVKEITKNFLTFAIEPVIDKMAEEINRKRYGEMDYKKGLYIKINSNSIQHIDVFELAEKVDKLLSSGIYCIDELREKLGDTPLNTDWSRRHYITKNYAEAEKLPHLGT